MKIVAGKLGGRVIAVPKSETRPVTEMARAAIFNVLGERAAGAAVLDLFAGSGALGFEALSRGATSVVFVDNSSKSAETIKKNAADLGVRIGVSIEKQDYAKFLAECRNRFDLIFLDPPYADFNEEVLTSLEPVCTANCIVVTSCSKNSQLSDTIGTLLKQKESIYGDTKIAYFTKK